MQEQQGQNQIQVQPPSDLSAVAERDTFAGSPPKDAEGQAGQYEPIGPSGFGC